MNRAYIYGVGSAVLALAAGVLYARQKRLQNTNEPSNLERAGVPDQLKGNELEQLENAKMVSEGSQFGVKYYNEAKEEQDLVPEGK